MTGFPEAVLARELAVCYTAIALVTDYDAGLDDSDLPAVTQEEVFRVFGENVAAVRALLEVLVPALPAERTCPCAGALDGIDLP